MTFPEWLPDRLRHNLPGKTAQIKMMPTGGSNRFPIPENTRKSSVLLLLFMENDVLSLILIKRSMDGSIHSGQIAFPGGKIEPTDPSPESAALREAFEEIHLEEKGVSILGRLSPLYIPVSGFEVIPIVGFQAQKPSQLLASQAEVAQILSITLSRHLQQKRIKEIYSSAKNGITLSAPVYQIDEQHFIWGASAMILSELEALWDEYHQIHETVISPH